MQITEFKELLQTYGADFKRWPKDKAKAGEALLESSAEARSEYADYAKVDALFAQNKNVNAPPGLLDRIMGAITKQKK